MKNLINKDVQFTHEGRTRRGFVYRRLGDKYEIIGEDDGMYLIECALCTDIDDEDLSE